MPIIRSNDHSDPSLNPTRLVTRRSQSSAGTGGVIAVAIIGTSIFFVVIFVLIHRKARRRSRSASHSKTQSRDPSLSRLYSKHTNEEYARPADSRGKKLPATPDPPSIPPEDLAHYNFMRSETPAKPFPPPSPLPSPNSRLDAEEIVQYHRENHEVPMAFIAFVSEHSIIDGVPHTASPASPTFSWVHNALRTSDATSYRVSVSVGRTSEKNNRDSIVSPQNLGFPHSGLLTRRSISGIGDYAQSSTLAPSSLTTPSVGGDSSRNKPKKSSRDLSAFHFPLLPSMLYPPSPHRSPTSASYRGSIRSSISPTTPNRSTLMIARHALRQSSTRRKAAQTFEGPLLADEIEVRVGDSLCVLETFDDAWCVAIVEESVLGDAEVKMGCVPLWVFDTSKRFGAFVVPVRPMRSTSLAVTVELIPTATAEIPSPSSPPFRPSVRDSAFSTAATSKLAAQVPQLSPLPWQQEPIISWSNF